MGQHNIRYATAEEHLPPVRVMFRRGANVLLFTTDCPTLRFKDAS